VEHPELVERRRRIGLVVRIAACRRHLPRSGRARSRRCGRPFGTVHGAV